MSESPLMIKSKAFALEVIRACKVLREAKCESAMIKIFENGGYLQLYNEYYSFEQFVWECSIYPYEPNKKFVKKYGEIAIRAITEAPLEYYLEK